MTKQTEKARKREFDKKALHPLQSWAWGSLRKSKRIKVVRFDEGFQITFHRIPKLPWTIGYCPKSRVPSNKDLKKIREEAAKQKAIAVKFEPNVEASLRLNMKKLGLIKGRSLFTKFSFWLDLRKSEKELFEGMKSKTRYNIRLAERKGVKIVEDSSNEGFEDYWRLMKQTTNRQRFYAHDKKYQQRMWQKMRQAGQAYLFKAIYKGEVLSTWILFILNEVLYYPYGASSRRHKEVMANNLLAWEVIKFGKSKGCKRFDMWGSLGKNPDKNNPWYGFHKFKEGYGGRLVEFVGSWDLVINPWLYWFYRAGEEVRWVVLRTLKKWRI